MTGKRCDGGDSWYCGKVATVNFIAPCGANANMCQECYETYTETCNRLEEYKKQQPHCLHCGKLCDVPSAFHGMIIRDKGQVCHACYPQYLKDEKKLHG